MKMYQLARFSLGNARSFAPIISGIRKLPSTAGIAGIRKKKTIITPCMREQLVVGVVGSTRSPAGVASSRRISTANAPPTKKKNVTAARYRSAMRLWSRVSSHELTPKPLFR